MAIYKRVQPFWLGLLLILLVAGALRLYSYDFSLPYLDYPDEPNFYLKALEWRGKFKLEEDAFILPVPGYIAVQAALQPLIEPLGIRDIASTTRVLRFISVIANLATAVVVALTARITAGDIAGLIAGGAWGLAPLVLENGVYALPDPLVYLLTALALYLSVAALLKPQRRGWSVGSVGVGLVAVLMKYPALPALAPGVLAALVILWHDRRRGTRLLAIQIALIAATAFWLLFIYGINLGNPKLVSITDDSPLLPNFLNLSRLINNLYFVIVPLNPLAFGLIAVAGIAAYALARRNNLPRVRLEPLWIGLIIIIGIAWLTNLYSEVDAGTVRYVLPATAVACVWLGLALWQIVQVLQSYQTRLPLLRHSAPLAFAAVGIMVWLPQLAQDWAVVQVRHLPDTRVELRQWFDANLDPGTVIVDESNHKTFNPIWGGIPHRHWVDWWVSDNIMEHPLAEWRDIRKMTYAALPYGELDAMQQTPEGQDYLKQMLRLRDFDGKSERGPQMAFYRLWRMQHETDVQFGDAIHLMGYDQSAATLKSGESLTFRFYWKANQPPTDNYSLSIHLTPESEYRILAQTDGAPAVPERPTLSWNDAAETLISPPFTLSVPADTPAGNYQIHIGLYNYVNGQRLPVENDTAYLLTLLPVSD